MFNLKLVSLFLAMVFTSSLVLAESSKRPNIIFILADDMGYGDMTCTGGKAATPHLDSIAKNGVLFTDAHTTSSVCSPSRYSLMTGRYNWRRLSEGIVWDFAPSLLNKDRSTIADFLKDQNYQTGMVGKWHLGHTWQKLPNGEFRKPTNAAADKYKKFGWQFDYTKRAFGMWLKEAGYATAVYGKWNIGETKGVSWPGAHGFDDWLIIDHNTGYFQHKNKNKDCQGRPMLFKTGGERVTNLEGQYLTEIWTDKAIDFMKKSKDQPFFLYLPWSIPHTPLQDPAADSSLAFDAGAKPKTVEGREVYVKMVEYLDSHIGRIFKSLKEQGKYDNTLIIFTSDNGGMISGNCWPLKKTKQHLEEGGIRVPFLMQWPNKIAPGTVNNQPAIMMDASLTVLAEGDAMKYVPKNRVLDGINLFEQNDEPREFGWRRRDWSWQGNYLRQEAYRSGDWKLIRSYQYLGNKKWSADYKEELYNLNDDLGEKNNLKTSMPEKHAEMVKAFDEWQDQTVEKNPSFWPEHADQLGSGAPRKSEDMIIFDFKNGKGNTRLHQAQNKDKISNAKYDKSCFSITLQGGMKGVTPILYKMTAVDTEKYSKALLRMKVTAEPGTDLGLAKIVVRHTE